MTTELVRQVQPVALQTQRHFVIKRRFWSFFERVFRVFTADGPMFMYVEHPLLKLREEFTVYRDESKLQPMLLVKSKQVIAINYAYEVSDIDTGQVLGAVQKRGLRSIVRDKFIIYGPNGEELGYAEEQGASLLRRIFPMLTSKHAIFVGGQQVAYIRQRFRFFTKEFSVDLEPSQLDPRFVLAVALLALLAEARREDND